MAIIAVLRNSYEVAEKGSKSAKQQQAISGAGWSSLAARRAHNPKVAGSNPAPATKYEFANRSLKT